MSGRTDVLCAGIIVADHACTPLERMPAPGELALVDDLPLSIGGCAANVAVNLTRMGVGAAVVGHVGDDAFGSLIGGMLAQEGVDLSHLKVSAGYKTSQTLIVNVAGEDRRFIHNFGANSAFTARDLPLEKIDESRVLYVGGYLLMPRLEQADLANALAKAQAAGVKTVLDVCVPGPGRHLDQLRAVLPYVDVFMPNDHEATLLTDEMDPVAQAALLHGLGARTVIVTCGGRGTVVVSETARLKAGVYPVEFVDGSGGGDAFAAGYICGLLEGLPVFDCVQLGSAMGASCVRSVGTTTSVFNRRECEEFVLRHVLPVEALALH